MTPTTVRGLPGLLSLPVWVLYRLWCATLRLDEDGFEGVRPMFDGQRSMVVAAWHEELFCLMAYKRRLRVNAIVSRSRDGDWMAALLKRLGIGTVRGSSSRGGMRALREMTRRIQEGESALITVDGPRGPRHKAKPGAIHLAVHEKVPVVPCRVYMKHSKTFSSWDRFQLPLPFSRVRMIWGKPYLPDANLDDDVQLQAACTELEERLNALLPHATTCPEKPA